MKLTKEEVEKLKTLIGVGFNFHDETIIDLLDTIDAMEKELKELRLVEEGLRGTLKAERKHRGIKP